MRFHISHGRWLVLIFLLRITLLYIVDCYRKFPIVKRADSLVADDLVKAAKIVFTEFGLLKKLISNAGPNLTSDTFWQFCRQMHIEHLLNTTRAVARWKMHKICKMNHQKCLDTNNDVNLAPLHIRSTPIGTGLPNHVTLLFNKSVRALLPQVHREAITSRMMMISMKL